MKTFETVSFHIVKPCNMKCKLCYATFDDMHVKTMSVHDAKHCIRKLFLAGVQKITFTGGEPIYSLSKKKWNPFYRTPPLPSVQDRLKLVAQQLRIKPQKINLIKP